MLRIPVQDLSVTYTSICSHLHTLFALAYDSLNHVLEQASNSYLIELLTQNMCNDADPNGDLVLVAGSNEEQKSIRVCSNILSFASPVFAAMLSPRFSEGQVSGQKDCSISLPEDDPEAMTVVCRSIHYQEDTPKEVSISLLEKVALVCDKYDVAHALRGWSEAALQSLSISMCHNTHTEILRVRLLYISYVLGSHQTFWEISYSLLHHCSRVALTQQEDVDKELINVPEDVFGKPRLRVLIGKLEKRIDQS